MRLKLQLKILLLVLPLVVMPLLWLGWAAYDRLQQISRDSSLGQMTTLLDQVSRNFESRLDTARANTELFAASAMLQKYILTSDESERYTLMQPPLMRLFASYQRAYPDYFEIRVLLPDGYEDTRSVLSPLPNKTEMEFNSAFFQHLAALDGSQHDMFTTSADTGEPVLYIGRKLISRDESFEPIGTAPTLRGYLVISINLDSVRHQIDSQTLGDSGYLFITDNSGKVMLAPDRVNTAGFDQDRYAGLNRPAVYQQAQQIRFNGVHAYLQGRKLHHDLELFAVMPESELLAASRELGLLVAGLTLLVILISSVMIMYAINRIMIAPIKRLRHMAREVGRSHFDTGSGISSNDEIGDLGKSLELMSSNLQQSQEQVAYLAYRDALTGMPNRRMFQEYLERALSHARHHDSRLALLFLDLDNFKQVNDTMGHEAGDTLLIEMSDRLTQCLRGEDEVALAQAQAKAAQHGDTPRDTVARLGGDEFLILLFSIKDPSAAAHVARRLLKMLARPFTISDKEFYVSCSIGISVYPGDGDDVDSLIKNADIAMYHAKAQGRSNYQYFNESMNVAAVERLNMENALRKAIRERQFVLHYQPKIDLVSGEIREVEALIRWMRPDEGMISPLDFIPLAEESGLIVPIGEWVIDEATRQLHRWQRDGIDIAVSVNISTVQLARQNVVAVIEKYLRQNACRADSLEIELTETSIVDAYARASEMLNRIKALGVRISMDDFGIGYSSFSYLRNLPIDILKIDQSFIRDIIIDKDDAAIVSAILAMARTLNLTVVAEGVETIEQLQFLRQHHCDIAQGFLISRPLPEPELRRLLDGKIRVELPEPGSRLPPRSNLRAHLEIIRKD